MYEEGIEMVETIEIIMITIITEIQKVKIAEMKIETIGETEVEITEAEEEVDKDEMIDRDNTVIEETMENNTKIIVKNNSIKRTTIIKNIIREIIEEIKNKIIEEKIMKIIIGIMIINQEININQIMLKDW
jgi:hypothetical protein